MESFVSKMSGKFSKDATDRRAQQAGVEPSPHGPASVQTIDEQLRKRVVKFDFVKNGVTGDVTTPDQLYIVLASQLLCYTGQYPAKLQVPVPHDRVWLCYFCKDMWYPENFIDARRQQICLIPYCEKCQKEFSELHPAQQNRILFCLPEAQLLLWGEPRAII